MVEDYKKLFESGNKAQLEQMNKHKHYTGWDNFGLGAGFNGIRKNAIKIEEQLYTLFTRQGRKKDSIDYEKVRERAANIANFAHMMILDCDKELNKNGITAPLVDG